MGTRPGYGVDTSWGLLRVVCKSLSASVARAAGDAISLTPTEGVDERGLCVLVRKREVAAGGVALRLCGE